MVAKWQPCHTAAKALVAANLCPLIHFSETCHAGTHYDMNSSGGSQTFSTPQPATSKNLAVCANSIKHTVSLPCASGYDAATRWILGASSGFSPKKAFPPVVELQASAWVMLQLAQAPSTGKPRKILQQQMEKRLLQLSLRGRCRQMSIQVASACSKSNSKIGH